MTCYLAYYRSKGANFQANAVLAAVQHITYCSFDNWEITEWDDKYEGGYTLFKQIDGLQLNITFYQNYGLGGDDLFVRTWFKRTLNPPTYEDFIKAEFQGIKYTTEIFNPLEIKETALYILERMSGFDTSNDA